MLASNLETVLWADRLLPCSRKLTTLAVIDGTMFNNILAGKDWPLHLVNGTRATVIALTHQLRRH